jgi:NADH dehydrogenase (ubiquinone) 1 alpha subcomplex subunit 9
MPRLSLDLIARTSHHTAQASVELPLTTNDPLRSPLLFALALKPGQLTMVKSQAARTALRAARSSFKPTFQRRGLQDIAITRTGKPIIRVQGGRSSLGGYTATVFGATGFLGRYIVNRLARQGCLVVVPYREEMMKRHLKVTGDLGRVNFMEFDLRNTQSIEESVRHADIVFNLIGRNYETKNFTYNDVHVEGTERIAEAVAKYDVDRFIHVSSYNADPDSPSAFFRSKVSIQDVPTLPVN